MPDYRCFPKLKEILVDQLGVDPDTINLSSNLREDLGADSLDEVEILMAVEEDFDIVISDEEAEKWKTVEDIAKHLDTVQPE